MKVLFLITLFSTALMASDHYLLFKEWPNVLKREVPRHEIVEQFQGMRIVRTAFENIEEFSHVVHENLGGCGGYWDITDRIEKGEFAELILFDEWKRDQRARNRYTSFAPVVYKDSVSKLVDTGNIEHYWNFLTELSSFPDRSATSDNGSKAVDFLENHARGIGGHLPGFATRRVETDMFMYSKQPSLVATIPGTNPSAPAVVVGGHMDTFSQGKPGADDDGSGSSVVMEALRAIGESNSRFEHTVHFIWYAAEERGLVGSRFVVSDFENQDLKVKAAIQFDMVGHDDPNDENDIYIINDYTDAGLNSTLRQLIETYTDASVGETECGYACSDHANWNRAGVPVSFPFEASFSNMNDRLHTGDDKIEYLEKAHANRFVRLALAFIGELALVQ